MMLAGLMLFVGALALSARGYGVAAAVLFIVALVVLIVGRPLPSVDDMIRKGRKP